MSLKRSFLDLFYLFLPSQTPFVSIIAYFYLIAGEVAPVRLKYLQVSEYAFKENKNTLKFIQVLLYTHFYNISLNVLRPNFLNICNLPISHFPNIRKIRVKVGPKTYYFSYFMSSCTDRIVVFNNFFSLIFSQPRDKQNRARDFLLFKYFLNNLLLTVFMQNTLSKLVELLQ